MVRICTKQIFVDSCCAEVHVNLIEKCGKEGDTVSRVPYPVQCVLHCTDIKETFKFAVTLSGDTATVPVHEIWKVGGRNSFTRH